MARTQTGKTAAPEGPGNTKDPVVPMDPSGFRKRLAAWFQRSKRDLPWRDSNDPYGVWLSEVMLQQTRVETVYNRYIIFKAKYPTVAHLARAEEDDVLALWSGLGYYRRARQLLLAAQLVMREFHGRMPRTVDDLRKLPGVGQYTAAAIASIGFGASVAVVDGNVERVLLRLYGLEQEKSAVAMRRLEELAQSLVPPAGTRADKNPPGDHNQAMMELGATVCLPQNPLCAVCPVRMYCRTRGEHVTLKRPPMRSVAVAHLLALRKRGVRTEVLLTRRPSDASQMPNMLELPQLALSAVEDREPVLRLRHAITNTNYLALIFAELAPDAPGSTQHSHPGETVSDPDAPNDDEDVVIALPGEVTVVGLRNTLPLNNGRHEWVDTEALPATPLTGLARKVLERLRVMRLSPVRVLHDPAIFED